MTFKQSSNPSASFTDQSESACKKGFEHVSVHFNVSIMLSTLRCADNTNSIPSIVLANINPLKKSTSDAFIRLLPIGVL
jgi:hypothetical protein